MNNKIAINELKSYAEHSWGRLSESFDIAIKAIEKQILKKVDQENDFLYCPVCERGGNSWDKPKYCRYCGQALNYNGTNKGLNLD